MLLSSLRILRCDLMDPVVSLVLRRSMLCEYRLPPCLLSPVRPFRCRSLYVVSIVRYFIIYAARVALNSFLMPSHAL